MGSIKAVFFDNNIISIDEEATRIGGAWQEKNAADTPVTWDMDALKFVNAKLASLATPVLVDVGANTGCFCLLPIVNRDLTVYAFEPVPETHVLLNSNIALNGISDKVITSRVALGDKNGEAALKLPASGKDSGLACIGKPLRFDEWQEIKVPLKTLDSWVRENDIRKIDFIKIDTEGCELFVLKGAEKTINAFKPGILVEFNDTNMAQFGYNGTDVINLLESWGYSGTPVGLEDIYFEHRTTATLHVFPDESNATVFDADPSVEINNARLNHLASLGLDLSDSTVLEVGAGVGRLTSFFEKLNCDVLSTDAREENIAENLKRHLHRKVAFADLSVPGSHDKFGTFEIVFCYGTLYHLHDPVLAIKDMAAVCTKYLLLETCVNPIDNNLINHAEENREHLDQSVHGIGCRPGRDWVFNELRKYFPYVYVTSTQPDHPDFPLSWPAEYKGYNIRTVFVASRTQLDLPQLVDHLPQRQFLVDKTDYLDNVMKLKDNARATPSSALPDYQRKANCALPVSPRVLYLYEDTFIPPYYLQFSQFHLGFLRLGCELERLDILKASFEDYRNAIGSFRPDVVFSFLRYEEGICKVAGFLKEYHPVVTLNWFQEDPNGVTAAIVEASKSYDYWFTQDPRTVPFWPTKTFFSPHAFDERWFFDRGLERKYDISVGTLLGNKLSEEMWWPCINEAAAYGKKACFLLNRPVGIPLLDPEVENFLRAPDYLPVWKELGLSSCSWEMPADEVGKAMVMNSSKIHLGLQRVRGDWEDDVKALFPEYRFEKDGFFIQTKARLFQSAASGCLTIMDDAPELAGLFQPGREMVVYEFGNMDDLREKLAWYTSHDEERERVARAGYLRAQREHTFSARIRQIFDQVRRDTGAATCSAIPGSPLGIISESGIRKGNEPLHLHLGCGEQHFDGYLNIDYPPTEHTVQSRSGADLFADITQLAFPFESVDEIRLHHVFEHFDRPSALAQLIRWHEWLKLNGTLRIETPDLIGSARIILSDLPYAIRQANIRHLFGSHEASWAYHLDGWSEEKFKRVLSALGFTVECRSWQIPAEPFAFNVEAIARKTARMNRADLLKACDEILRESMATDVPGERGLWEVWKESLRTRLVPAETEFIYREAPREDLAKQFAVSFPPSDPVAIESRLNQAIVVLDRAIAGLPGNVNLLTGMGNALNRLGHSKEATMLFDTVALLERERSHMITEDIPPVTCRNSGHSAAKSGPCRTVAVFMSKDRALQLDAALRSFYNQCGDPHSIDLNVYYKASTPRFERQYRLLQDDFPSVRFIPENRVKEDFISLISGYDYFLGTVDDNIFIRPFRIAEMNSLLDRHQEALGLSLRLGTNTTYCYMANAQQNLPTFSHIEGGFLSYDWRSAEHDFGYAIEISSTIYRVSDFLPIFRAAEIKTAHDLEAGIFDKTGHFREERPQMICNGQSLLFSAPLNITKSDWTINRRSDRQDFSLESLAGLFDEGLRIIVDDFSGFTPIGCHQEIDPRFETMHPATDNEKGLAVRERPPAVSVIIPCYNQGRFLPDSVGSILSQTFTGWEIIIVNDGSSDDTTAVARGLIASNPGKRISLIEKPNTGVEDTRNRGIEASLAEWILPLDCDDMFAPTFLERAFGIVASDPAVNLVFANIRDFGAKEGDGWCPADYSPETILNEDTFPYASLYKKSLWREVGGYPQIPLGAEDWCFWIACSRLGLNPRRISEQLFLYRQHDNGSNRTVKMMENWQTVKSMVQSFHQALFPLGIVMAGHEAIAGMSGTVLEDVNRLIARFPDLPKPYFWKGLAAEKNGDLAEAAKLYEESVRNSRLEDWQPLWRLAHCYEEMSREASLRRDKEETIARARMAMEALESAKSIMSAAVTNKRIIFKESALAHKYCTGKGLEIGGAAHNPFGLNTLNVDVFDSMETIYKQEEIRVCGTAMPVDIVAPGDDIPLPDASQDFIVSSHVLEHFPNPVKALLEWDRLVRPGGIIFMIVPHKERTFDHVQPRTELRHLIEDYENSATEPHKDAQGHDHCWITDDIIQLCLWMIRELGVKWELVEVQDVDDKVGNGFTIVIRKTGQRHQAEASLQHTHEASGNSLLYVVHGFPPDAVGGVEVYTRNLALEMLAKGDRVTVLYPVTDLSGPAYTFTTSLCDGLRLVKFHVPRGQLFTSMVSDDIDKAFSTFLNDNRFDLIHFHHLFDNLSMSMVKVAKETSVPVAVTLHDFWFICPRFQLFIENNGSVCSGPESPGKCADCVVLAGWFPSIQRDKIEEFIAVRHGYARGILSEVDLVFAPSRFVADTFERYNFGGGRIRVAPLGVGRIAMQRRKWSGAPRFGYMGTIHPVKNVLPLARAFAATHGEATLHLYGGGETRWIEELKNSITDPRIFYHGSYTPVQLPEMLDGMDLLVVPSLVESYCLTVREALSAGIPVLAARAGGIPEIVQDGVNGLLFDPFDNMELARLLQQIITCPDSLGQLDVNAIPVMSIANDAGFLSDRYSEAISRKNLPMQAPQPAASPITVGALAEPADVASSEGKHGKIKVAVYSMDNQNYACGHYRIKAPLTAFAREVEVIWGIQVNEKKEFTINTERLEEADLIIVQRFLPRPDTKAFLDHLCSLGKPVVYEIDDLLTQLPETNPNHKWGMKGAPHIHEFMRRCAAVTVSTEELKSRYSPYNDNIHVLPNMLDSGLWTKPSPPSEGPVVIGYAGTNTHGADLELLEEVLERISSRYGSGVAFTFMGCATERISRLPGFRFVEFETTFEAYADKLMNNPMDIVLAPLEDNPFNRCKSNVKWLEYSACGIAGVYSDLPPYACVRSGETGLLAKNRVKEWYDAISYLIDNPEKRREMARNARNEVMAGYTVTARSQVFLDTYRKIIGVQKPSVRNIRFSIIIMTWNRAEMLDQCLSSLFANLSDTDSCEIIVGNNGSTDRTEEVIGRYRIDKHVKKENKIGLEFYRELFDMAEGEYIIDLDDDVIDLPKDFDRVFIDCFKAFPDYGFLGLDVVRNRFTNGAKPEETEYSEEVRNGRTVQEGRVIGCCACIAKDTFEKIGGFTGSDLSMAYVEDGILTQRVQELGMRTGIIKDVKCFHACGPHYSAAYGYLDRDIEKYEMAGLHRFAESYRPFKENINMEGSPGISIIIPLYNKVEYTRQCLEALAANTPSVLNYEVIFVDNASSDGTSEYLRSLSGDVTIITNLKNLGFARACNQGGRLATGDCLVFLNNDTIPKPGWLEALIDGLEHDGAHICGSRLLYPDGRVQHAGVAFNEQGIGYHIFNGLDGNDPAATRKRFMQCVTGACMAMRKELFLEMNGFDEGYINGFEDVDLCLRAGEMGKKVLYVPDSKLVHFEESSEGRKTHDEQNARRFLGRWMGKVRCDDNDFYRQEGYGKEMPADGRIRIFKQEKPQSPPSDGIRNPDAIERRLERADSLVREGKFDDAVATYWSVLRADAGNHRAMTGVGVVRLMTGELKEAENSFNDALAINPADAKAMSGLGMVRRAQGKEQEAFECFRKALDRDPENLTALSELLKASYRLNRFAEAEKYLEAYLRYHPADLNMLFSLAGVQVKMGKNDEAMEKLDKVLLFDPGFEGALEMQQMIAGQLQIAV